MVAAPSATFALAELTLRRGALAVNSAAPASRAAAAASLLQQQQPRAAWVHHAAAAAAAAASPLTAARPALMAGSGASAMALTRSLSTSAVPRSASPILSALAAKRQAPSAGPTPVSSNAPLAFAAAGAALILYITSLENSKSSGGRTVHCENLINTNFPTTSKADPKSVDNPLNPDGKYSESKVNLYQLSFGTITGLCAGIFIKKGLKALAFLLGAGYVFLQYLSSQRLVNVNWNKIGSTYDRFVDRAAGETGVSQASVRGWRGSKLQRIWSRLVDFLTADFQPRATFLAGLLLGFRLG